MHYYTGVGSRETPLGVKDLMGELAFALGEAGFILRSGGADGADKAFSSGATLHQQRIYLPWPGFNNNKPWGGIKIFDKVGPKALELAQSIHPAWYKLSQAAQKLHARNCYQVLGTKLDTPSKFLICWTKDGKSVGGTRTAIILAEKYNVPVYNLAVLSNKAIWDIVTKEIKFLGEK